MIHLTNKELKKPPKITRDSRGTLIEEGLRVAYNYSGDVRIGTIVRLKKSDWTMRKNKGQFSDWIINFQLEIMGENNILSTIKNPNSFVII